MSRKHTFALRSVDVGRHLDLFLVCAVASVLGNRVFLIITGYPQLGNGTLHISHAIWGALMMAIAIIIAIAFLPPFTRTFVAFLGGAGFGWFIDELGKFITRDVNYFFEPTIALIYMTFVAMYLVFRSIQGRSFGPDEALLNAIDSLKSAAIGRLDESRRRASIGLLVETGSSGALSDSVRDLLADVPALPARAPGWFTRTGEDLRSRYREFTKRHSFTIIVNTLLIIVAVVKVVTVVSLALDGRGVRGFAEWASVISSVVAGVLIVIGAFSLRRSKLAAYQWFERGLLVEILVTQVFVFAEEQLAGVIGLTYTIVLWLMVRSASRAEREREALADADVPRADSASPVSDPVS